MPMSRAKPTSRRRGGAPSRLSLRARDAHTALWLTRRLWRPVALELFAERSRKPRRRSRLPALSAARLRTRRR